MQKITRLSLFFLFLQFVGYTLSQSSFSEFRALESRVKYINPDSLYRFSISIDTTLVLDKAIHHWAKGKSYFWNSDYPNAYAQLDQASQLIKELDNKSMLAEISLDLSSSLAIVDRNGRALSFALKARELLKDEGNKEQQTRAAISLGDIYRKIGQYEGALKMLRETLPKTNDLSYNKSRCLNRMAAVYSETGKYDSSLVFSQRALELAHAIGDLDLIATSENEIGYVLRQQNQFKESLVHFFKADSIWRSLGMFRFASNPMHHVSVVYRSINKFDLALDYTQQAYSLVKEKGWYKIEMNLLDDLKMCHIHFENNDSVLFYDNKRLEAANAFITEQYAVNTKMVELLFTQEENEHTIREQEVLLENEALERQAIDRERSFLWITLSLIAMILLIIFIYANKQRTLKNQLTQENLEKESKNEQLTVALHANEALVQEISHRVKNNLAVLSGLLTMQANRSGSEKVRKELADSILRIESIATIHNKLYDKRSDAKVDLKEALSELSQNVVSAMGKNPSEDLEMNLEEVGLDIAEAVTLCLIVNEAITNSCKYANVGSSNKLRVNLFKKNNALVCRIIDHGPGFDEKEVPKATKSLGVYLIRLLSKQLGAKLKWEKTEESFIMSIELRSDG